MKAPSRDPSCLAVRHQVLERSVEALTLSNRRYQALFELAPVGYLLLSPGGHVEEVAANPKALLLLQLDHAKVIRSLFLLADCRVHRVADDDVGVNDALATDLGPVVV